ncbi:2-oxoacid:ferredoxin oxidoreductase subunit beta [Candidatus Falkowbacteria bacterium]|nr:2-oxoacid:ferredoxin oxidoreductase subunit beta [Candidatus Falkowbacteria bacterium]
MSIEQFNSACPPTWCPGCGNYSIWNEVKRALDELKIPQHKILIVYGIGCSGNMYNTIKTYAWHSLHGRAIPTAVGAKLANKDLTVIAIAGDGDGLGEGMGHFIHALRGNVDITYLVHENKVYGLTTGQSAPTSEKGFVSKSTPEGLIEVPVNPLTLAMSAGGSFVSRGYAGRPVQLKELIKQAILHKGFSLVDILQPCVTFNKIDTYQYYNDKVYELSEGGHNPNDYAAGYAKAREWGEKIPLGLFYQDGREAYEDDLPQEKGKAIVARAVAKRNLEPLYKEFM